MRLDERPSGMRVKKRRGLRPEAWGSPVLGGQKERKGALEKNERE